VYPTIFSPRLLWHTFRQCFRPSASLFLLGRPFGIEYDQSIGHLLHFDGNPIWISPSSEHTIFIASIQLPRLRICLDQFQFSFQQSSCQSTLVFLYFHFAGDCIRILHNCILKSLWMGHWPGRLRLAIVIAISGLQRQFCKVNAAGGGYIM